MNDNIHQYTVYHSFPHPSKLVLVIAFVAPLCAWEYTVAWNGGDMVPGELLFRYALSFLAYSFLGWVLESAYILVRTGKWVNTGFLYGPYLPMCGLAGLMMGFAPRIIPGRYGDHPLTLFVFGFFLLAFLQYITYWAMEKCFAIQWMDCSQNYLNIQGKVCLFHAICWGMAGMVVGVIVHPMMMQYFSSLDSMWIAGMVAVTIGFMLADFRLSIRRVSLMRRTMWVLESMGGRVKEDIEATQAEYERKLAALLDQQRVFQQQWRHQMDEKKEHIRRNPYDYTIQTQLEIEASNEELRANLRRLKEEMVREANQRDEALEALLYDLKGSIEQSLDLMKTSARYKNLKRMFGAFPAIEPLFAHAMELDERIKWYIWDETKKSVLSAY